VFVDVSRPRQVTVDGRSVPYAYDAAQHRLSVELPATPLSSTGKK